MFALKDHGDWLYLGTDYVPWFPSVRPFYKTWNESWDCVIESMAHRLQHRARR
jgi:hypothetical protein